MKILMVCLGNICRSPMAEGILRKKAEQHKVDMVIDSAGTGAWHAGQNPDRRAIQTAKRFGIDISGLIARQFTDSDFDEFDHIYVMDMQNYRDVMDLARSIEDREKVSLLLEAAMPGSRMEVPDPYYGINDGFVEVFRMMDEACEAIAKKLHASVYRDK